MCGIFSANTKSEANIKEVSIDKDSIDFLIKWSANHPRDVYFCYKLTNVQFVTGNKNLLLQRLLLTC